MHGAPGTDASSATQLGNWTTARSGHFLLHTDAGVGAIDAIIARFEDTYQALSASFFSRAEVPEVEALVFGDESEYRAIAGGSAGRFLAGLGTTGGVLVVRHTEDPQALEEVVAHELAHRFVNAVHPDLPNWLDEGIATYFGSVEVREAEVRFGAAPRRAVHDFAVAGGVSFTDLVSAAPERLYGPEARFFYSAGWALVNYLLIGREGSLRPRFAQLLAAIEEASRTGRRADAAFAQVYPDVPAAELDQAIQRLTASLGRPTVDRLLVLPFPPSGGRVHQSPARRSEAARGPGRRRPAPELARARAGGRPRRAPALRRSGRTRGHPPRPHRPSVRFHVLEPDCLGSSNFGLGPLGYTAAGLARYHASTSVKAVTFSSAVGSARWSPSGVALWATESSIAKGQARGTARRATTTRVCSPRSRARSVPPAT